MKRFLSLLMALAMVLSLLPVAAFADGTTPTITAETNKTEAAIGDTVEVTFTLANNPGFNQADMTLTFDQNVLRFTGLKQTLNENSGEMEYEGRFSTNTEVNTTEGNAQYGNIQHARTNTTSTGGKLFVAQFTVIGAGNTTVGVTVNSLNAVDNDGATTDHAASVAVTPSAEITVAGIPATAVTLDKTELSLEEGQNFLLVATVEPTNTTDKVGWASDNTAVATVSDYGQVVAVGEGTANITATAGEAVRTCVVTVTKEKSIVKTGGTEDAALTGVRELKINDKVETVKNVYKVSLNGHEQTDLSVSGSSIGAVVYAIDGTAVAGAQYGTSMDRQPMNQSGYEIQTRELLVSEAQLTAAVGESSISKLKLSHDYIYAFLFVKDGMANMNYGILFEITPVPATGVEVQENMALAAGETGELTVSVLPADTTDDMTVTYSSDNKAVATVDEKGVVTAVDSGEAVITVSAAGHSATCTVTVASSFTEIKNVPGNGDEWAGSMTGISIKDVTVNNYSWNGQTLNVYIAEDTATATVVFNFNKSGYDSKYEQTAAITNGSGTLTKTFTHDNGWDSYESTWVINFSKSVPATAIALDKTSMEMAAGTTGTIGATLTPENASGKITWNSSNPKVATVDQNGLVTAVANGAATITAAIDGFSATCQVTVSTATELPGLSDSEGLQKVYVLAAVEEHTDWVKGTDGVYSANAILPKGTADGTQIKVTFEATTYGNTISEDVVCTLANGTAKAEYNFVSQWDASFNKNYVLNFIVAQDVESVSLDQTAISLPSAGSAQLNATVAPESAAGMLIWSSTDETVVKVSNGALTAVGAGTATITAKAGDKTATCTVTVAAPYTIPASEVPVVEGTYTVSDFTVTKATVESHSWDGDTLNIILPAGTPNGTEIQLNTPVTNTSTSKFYVGTTRVGVGGSKTGTTSITITEGTATATINIGASKNQSDIKSYTVNVTVGGSAEPEPTTYAVNIDENITGGTVTADPASAAEGATVTLTQVPNAGYEFMEFSVTDAEGNAVDVTESIVGEDITYTFTMPAGNVTVSAEYRELPNTITDYEVSHPLMETKSVEIDGETHENINVLSLFQGYAEKLIEVIETLVEDKISAQHLKFTTSNEDVAKIVDGKVIPGIPGTALITVEPADNEAAAATFNLLRNNNAQQFAVVVSEVPAGYTVVMPADTDPGVGDTFQVDVTVGSDTENAPVNAYDMTFTYDPAKLELVSQGTDPEAEYYLSGLHVGGKIPAGTIHMERYGQNQTADDVAFTLNFKVLEAGNAAIQVTSAKVGTSQEALEKDAAIATLADPVTQITSNYKVSPLPDGFTGAPSVAPNKDYTFSGNAHYNYTFSVTIGGQPVPDAVDDKGNGNFVIDKKDINGNINIELEGDPVGKTYNVTLGEDMVHTSGMVEEAGVTKVQYMRDYTATLTPAEGYHYYNLTVTIGGAAYSGYETDKNENGTTSYKIPGKDITGDIVFTHDKSQLAANEVAVTFTGNGATDRAAGTAEKATIDEAYSFTLDKKAGFNYTVTYKMGDVTEFTAMDQNDNVYSIGKVTGAITINIEKVNDLEVQVTNYINLNGKTMFLVTATQTLEEGKVLAYDNNPMFQKTYTYVTETPEGTTTEEKTEWVYLVMVDKAAEGAEPVVFDAAAAKAKITDITATTTVLGKTFNVNESGIGDGDSVGTVDINDAQLVFDMYNNVYQDFNTASMQKFLKADVNGDKTVGVMDAAAIVSHIIAAKNA